MQSHSNNDVSATDLDNIEYFSELAKRETDHIRSTIEPCLDETVPPAVFSVMQQLAINAGELAARVRILENALELQLADPDPLRNEPLLRGTQSIDIENLARQLDCHPPESGENGRMRVWTRSAGVQFQLDANRSRPKFVRLWFEAIIKSEYARGLEVQVDGQVQQHAVLRLDGQFALEWELPRSEDLARTKVDIRLPDIHSPAELGESDDDRQLGIAITGLEFDAVRRQSLLSRLMRR